MRQILMFIFLGTVLFSCKKDKVQPPCSGILITGERTKLLGTWRWYKTWVNQTFASGNTYTFDYTPDTEGYNYYFTISKDGIYRGYKDNVLIHEHVMSKKVNENFEHPITQYLETKVDCSDSGLRFIFNNYPQNFDTINLWEYPIRFDDEIANKHSKLNFFTKQ